jgi:hypothetical protein
MVRQDISNEEIQKNRRRKEKVYGRAIHEYVPLYINPQNPMIDSKKVRGHTSNLIILEIIPHILVQVENTLFSDGNASQSQTNFYNNQNDMENINWELLQRGLWEKNTESHRIMCSEILIPDIVEIFYLNKIIMKDSLMLEKTMKLFPNHKGIELEIKESFFETKRLN